MNLNYKNKETEVIEPDNSQVDNKLELLKYTSQVTSRLKKDITPDFTLANLDEKDKEAIVELTSDAYFSKKILNTLALKTRVWEYDHQTKTYKRKRLPIEQRKYINKLADQTFDAFMIKLNMTAIVKRNDSNNFLIKLLGGVYHDKDDDNSNQGDNNLLNKLKRTMENEKKEQSV